MLVFAPVWVRLGLHLHVYICDSGFYNANPFFQNNPAIGPFIQTYEQFIVMSILSSNMSYPHFGRLVDGMQAIAQTQQNPSNETQEHNESSSFSSLSLENEKGSGSSNQPLEIRSLSTPQF